MYNLVSQRNFRCLSSVGNSIKTEQWNPLYHKSNVRLTPEKFFFSKLNIHTVTGLPPNYQRWNSHAFFHSIPITPLLYCNFIFLAMNASIQKAYYFLARFWHRTRYSFTSSQNLTSEFFYQQKCSKRGVQEYLSQTQSCSQADMLYLEIKL